MGDAGFASDEVRDGMRTLLALTLSATVSVPGQTELTAAAAALELAAYELTRGARAAYASAVRSLRLALPDQVGLFPDEIAAKLYVTGAVSARATLGAALAAWPASSSGSRSEVEIGPRETIRRLFAATLVCGERGGADRVRAAALATALEASCFNTVVRSSRCSDEPPRRQWDSPAFSDAYSARCGTIATLLDPASEACRCYDARVADALWDGTLEPSAVGAMSERELCPQATAAERQEIAYRSDQKVAERSSALFRCPHCGARDHTWQQVQLRSADEAPDYLCKCNRCDGRFKGRS